MKIRILVLALLAAIVAGCGGGGSTVTGLTPSPSPGTVTIKGAAANGLIKNGTVKVYLASSNLLLASTTTDANGNYTVSIASQTGPVIIEVSGGKYVDEATGTEVPLAAPLRAALSSVTGGTIQTAVTPLTELAVKLAGSDLSAAAITSKNNLVSDLFKFDILTTQPVEPTLQAFQSSTQAQKDYTLALAGISQQANDKGGTIATVVESYRADIAVANRMSESVATIFKNEVSAFIAGPKNQTGTTTIATTGLVNAGSITYPVKLNVSGTFASGSFIKGLQLQLMLPEKVTLRAAADGKPVTGILTASGSAASHSTIEAKYDATTRTVSIGIMNVEPGFGLGEFITINCTVAPGAALNAANFTISDITASDNNGEPIVGLTVFVSL